MTTLTCPKCHGAMRTYERNGVTLDQCGDCRGIFLDRGELEHLIDAETRFNAPPAPQAQAPLYQEERRDYDRRRDDNLGYQQPYRQRKKSIFEELFD